jgi:hypothetical protein
MTGAAATRFKNVVKAAIAGSPAYNFSAYHAARAYELFKADTDYDWSLAAKLAVAMTEKKVAEAEAEIAQGRRPSIGFDQYLYAGGELQNIATTLDWCADFVLPELRQRCLSFMRQTVYNLEHPLLSNWGGQPENYTDGVHYEYAGWGRSDALNNYFYAHLLALVNENLVSGGDRTYINSRFDLLRAQWGSWDTGSPEGTGYGLALGSLFTIIKLWSDSTGEQFPLIERLANRTIEFWIHCSIRDYNSGKFNEIVTFMDHSRQSRHLIYDGDRNLMLAAGALSMSALHQEMAAWWLGEVAHTAMGQGNQCHTDMITPSAIKTAPTETMYHATSSGHFLWRVSWAKDSTLISYACGPNDQAHDQDDQGEFQVYHKGPQAVTANMWSAWGIMRDPKYHNVLRFDSLLQRKDAASLCKMTVISPNNVMMGLTPTYTAASGIKHTRQFVHDNATIFVDDIFTLGTAKEAVFQINTPYLPVVTGNTIKAGLITWTVQYPLNAVISIVDWATVSVLDNPANPITGYKIEIRGGVDRYTVSGAIDTLAAPIPLPGVITPTPKPSEVVMSHTNTTVPQFPAGYWIHTCPGASEGMSWHWQTTQLWIPANTITMDTMVATDVNRTVRKVLNLEPTAFVHCMSGQPMSLTDKNDAAYLGSVYVAPLPTGAIVVEPPVIVEPPVVVMPPPVVVEPPVVVAPPPVIVVPPTRIPQIDVTAVGSAYWVVKVDGVQASRHSQQAEAQQNAVNAELQNPGSAVTFEHNAIYKVQSR